MPVRHVVVGQKVTRPKVARSRELRRDMTPAEAVLWRYLRNSQVAGLRFRRQQVIDGFIVDFYCHAAGVIVNVDGAVHAQLVEADAERDMIFRAQGFVSLHLTNEEVLGKPALAVAKVAAACREAMQNRMISTGDPATGTPPRAGEGPGVRSA